MSRLLDWIHDHSCGDYTLFFRFYELVHTECPCCTFYRGIFIGLIAGALGGYFL